jgi:hypothetical protein
MGLLLGAVDALNRHVDGLAAAMLTRHALVTIVDAQRQAAGTRLVSLELPGWLAAVALQAIVLFWFWRSGTAARWRDALRARFGSDGAVRFAFGAILALLARVAAAIPSFYLWRVERVMGLSTSLTRVWAYEYALGTILGMIVAGCVVAAVLRLAERTHQWYLYTIAGIVAISLIGTVLDPYVVAPLFDRYAPLQGAAAARAFAARDGYPNVPIVVEHRLDRTPADPAKTQGMGATQRIVLADSLVAVSTPDEVRYYIADSVAQLDEHDPLDLALIDAAIVILATALAVVIADRVSFRRDDDPISRVTLVGALLAIMYVPAVLVDHHAVAAMQVRAARAAVATTGDRASALRALVRAGDENIVPVCPSAGRAILDRSPSLGAIAAAVGGASGCP